MPDITSRPFRVDPEKACEACVFGRGEHAEWCKEYIAAFNAALRDALPEGLYDPRGDWVVYNAADFQSR